MYNTYKGDEISMILDGVDIGLGEVVIKDSKCTKNNLEIPIFCIDIYNADHTYRFTFWTQREYHEYNKLPLYEKVDILDMIDDYDIDFGTRENGTINTRDNTKMYFTRIDNYQFILNAEIIDFSKSVIGNEESYSTLQLKAIIDFKNDHE